MAERRVARRYDLSIPIIVHTPVENEAAFLTGKTRDISARGVYFTIDNDLSIGAELDMKMTLSVEASTEVFIRATGKVVRVDKRPGNHSQPIGVAAVIELHEIVRSEVARS